MTEQNRKPDFSGYATRFNVECTDGRIIRESAFKHMDGKQVPLLWQHSHDNQLHVLGHAILEHREDGTYAHAYFNETERGVHARILVEAGDIKALSIFAAGLKEVNKNVMHGDIKEVSLVLAGANVGAFIDNVTLRHSDNDELIADAIIYTGEEFTLAHADADGNAEEGDTYQDVFDSLSSDQKDLFYAMLEQATSTVEHSDTTGNSLGDASTDSGEKVEDEASAESKIDDTETQASSDAPAEDAAAAPVSVDPEPIEVSPKTPADEVQHNAQEGNTMANVFQTEADKLGNTKQAKTLSHADLIQINESAKKSGSYKEAFEGFMLEHADTYGIDNIDLLFPDAKATSTSPELIARQAEWVPRVLGATKHSPFAKIKTVTADLTAEEARAKGYIKGTEKKDEVLPILRRTTSPTTIYKKQKLDRDDILDITDLDIVAWLKWEIRFMLNEEIARAILVGDGRAVDNPDKVKDPRGAVDGVGIRSIANDNEVFAHKVQLVANISSEALIDAVTRARVHYRGSGSPTFYTTDDVLTDLLLLKDKMGRRLYGTEAELASALRVKEIVTVEVMNEYADTLGIIVNLVDYTIGANKGGELTFFEDFDIDFNQHKYLLETRISGALTKPKSAIVIMRELGTEVTPQQPAFDPATNTVTIPDITGVQYLVNNEVVAAGALVITSDTEVTAEPTSGYYFPGNTQRTWSYVYNTAA